MPKLKVERIVSFSSEDSVHVAENILTSDSKKKWLCKSEGETSAVVILQLEKPSLITGIDIGNENSAFIEVLVGRSSLNSDDYKVLLTMSSFMTPMDSRQSQNINRVRMFKTDNFCKPVCEERWDRVKICCTQPFNKRVQYGLSFVVVHSNQGTETESVQVSKVGKFNLKPDAPVDDILAGSLFTRRKEFKDEKPPTAAAAIRQASKTISNSPKCNVQINSPKQSAHCSKNDQKKRNHDKLLYDDNDSDDSNSKVDQVIKKNEQEKSKRKKDTPDSSSSHKKVQNTCSSESSSTKRKSEPNTPEKPTKKTKILKMKPFKELLSGVVIAISGYQNPLRSEVRRKALDMGAKYKPDWGQGCTHLICAFQNTPKYRQVLGHGKIVTSRWIEDCYSRRKKIPWRQYALNPSDQRQPESEDEILDEATVLNDQESTTKRVDKKYNISSDSADTDDEIEQARLKIEQDKVLGSVVVKDNDSDNNNESFDRLSAVNPDDDKNDNQSLKDDNNEENLNNLSENKEDDVYDCDTDIEDASVPADIITDSGEFEPLPNIFENMIFYIDDLIDGEELKKLNRLIVAYNGKICNKISDAEYFLTNDRNSAMNAKDFNPDLTCIKPAWVEACRIQEELISMDDFKI